MAFRLPVRLPLRIRAMPPSSMRPPCMPRLVQISELLEYGGRNGANPGLNAVAVSDERRHVSADGGSGFIDHGRHHLRQRPVACNAGRQSLLRPGPESRQGATMPSLISTRTVPAAASAAAAKSTFGPSRSTPSRIPCCLHQHHIQVLCQVVVDGPHLHGHVVQAAGQRRSSAPAT